MLAAEASSESAAATSVRAASAMGSIGPPAKIFNALKGSVFDSGIVGLLTQFQGSSRAKPNDAGGYELKISCSTFRALSDIRALSCGSTVARYGLDVLMTMSRPDKCAHP